MDADIVHRRRYSLVVTDLVRFGTKGRKGARKCVRSTFPIQNACKGGGGGGGGGGGIHLFANVLNG